MEYTVVLVKPDFKELEQAVKNLVERIHARCTRKQIAFTRQVIEQFYPQQATYFEVMDEYYRSRLVIAFLIEGHDVVQAFRNLKLSIVFERKLKKPKDGIHASDSFREAQRERSIIFGDQP